MECKRQKSFLRLTSYHADERYNNWGEKLTVEVQRKLHRQKCDVSYSLKDHPENSSKYNKNV